MNLNVVAISAMLFFIQNYCATSYFQLNLRNRVKNLQMKPNQTKQQVKQQNDSITKINICLSWQRKTVPELMKSCAVDNVAAVDNGADVGELKQELCSMSMRSAVQMKQSIV